MPIKVYTSGNYIVVDNGTTMSEYAKGYTTYTYVQSTQTFTIKETVGGEYKITRTQILAGDITDEPGTTAFTFNSFVTFLRENTGFKTAPGGSGAEYTETIVNISSAQIQAANVTDVTLLASQSGLNYDEVDKVVVEYTHNGTPYSISGSGFIKIFRLSDSGSNGPIKWIYGSMLSTSESSIVVPETSTVTQTIGFPQQTNNRQTLSIMQSALVLRLTHAATLGNGTLRIKVYSKQRTFGA